ncbi:MAG TPA: glycosyltransferase family 2 protein, partial [Rhabdochlamydiaceae bacterium]
MTEMISTIITTYRRPLLLKRAINSILRQTYPHFQVCVYDNASGDETEKIVLELMKKDSRVKYHRHQENIGMMANYQYALDRINAPFFSFLSDDDFLLPHFYEEALKGFCEFPTAAFSACGVWQIDEKGGFVGDPLSRWKSEGFFSSPRGLLEMIRTKHGFPVPTGILFQSKCL